MTNASGADITSFTDIANLQPFRYRGYYYDYESGFYYLQSRYYDPVTHRFINADGLVSTGTGVWDLIEKITFRDNRSVFGLVVNDINETTAFVYDGQTYELD